MTIWPVNLITSVLLFAGLKSDLDKITLNRHHCGAVNIPRFTANPDKHLNFDPEKSVTQVTVGPAFPPIKDTT